MLTRVYYMVVQRARVPRLSNSSLNTLFTQPFASLKHAIIQYWACGKRLRSQIRVDAALITSTSVDIELHSAAKLRVRRKAIFLAVTASVGPSIEH
jgi:hypothetical protein